MRIWARWGNLKGSERRPSDARVRQEKLYQAAKYGGDRNAAKTIVDELASNDPIERLIGDTERYMLRSTPLVFLTPVPAFGSPGEVGEDEDGNPTIRNVLAPQFAAHVAEQLGGEIDTEIVQVARVGRTEARDLQRVLWQPRFEGKVRKDVAYVLVDDVLTQGGTMACLRSYIVANGGTVGGFAALAHGTGRDQALALSDATWERLHSEYGDDLRGFWSREIGHDALFLTEAEGRFLSRWLAQNPPRAGAAALHHLRDSLLTTAGGGQRS